MDPQTEAGTGGDMADPTEARPATEEKPTKVVREKSAIGFAYEDLSSALRLAEAAYNTFGGKCSVSQLAAKLQATPTSGAFRLKVGAGRLFGVLGGTGPTVTVTGLGVDALDQGNTGARADAFLNVPLHRSLYDEFSSKSLPDDAGLEVRIRQLGVSTKQVTTARQVFMRSAEQAGFFAHGRTRLVLPPRGTVLNGAGSDASAEDSPADRSEVPDIMKHPLIQGLLAVLPEPGTEFPEEERQLWLKTLDMNLSFIYARTTTPSVVPRDET